MRESDSQSNKSGSIFAIRDVSLPGRNTGLLQYRRQHHHRRRGRGRRRMSQYKFANREA